LQRKETQEFIQHQALYALSMTHLTRRQFMKLKMQTKHTQSKAKNSLLYGSVVLWN